MPPSKSRTPGANDSPVAVSKPRPTTPSSTRRPSTAAGSTSRTRRSLKSEPNSPPPASAALTSRPRLSLDRFPRSAEYKPTVVAPPPDVNTQREAELLARLDSAQEDLSKAKDQLAFIAGERDRLAGQLNQAKRVADDTHDKLQDALMAKRWAEEATEIEKFRADELEQVGIDQAHTREEEWRTVIECVRGQHAADLQTLLATAQELDRFRRELAVANDAKKAALGHADDAMKIAEVHAEKVEILSSEVAHLKALIHMNVASQVSKSREAEVIVKNLECDVSTLKGKLEQARAVEDKLFKMEKLTEGLKSELDDAMKAKSDAHQLFEQCKNRAGSLETELEKATLSEKFISDSLAAMAQELDNTQSVLQDKESEIEVIKGKTTALEIEVARLLADINESNEHLDASQQEVFGLHTTIDVLRNQIESAEQAASEALTNAEAANVKIEVLAEDKIKLISELEDTRNREEKEKRAVEDLTAALNETSGKANDAHERFVKKEDDYGHALVQIGDLKMTLKSTKESYEVMLDEANNEISGLRKTVETVEAEVNKYGQECEAKELEIITSSKQSEEEIATLKVETNKVAASLLGAVHELEAVNAAKDMLQEKLGYTESAVAEANNAVQEAKADKKRLQEKLMYKELAVSEANKAVQEAKAESFQLKERLLDKENVLLSITHENEEFRLREADAVKKIDELSALLAEAMTKKHPEEEEKLVVVDESHNKIVHNKNVHEEADDAVTENEEPKPEPDVVTGDYNGAMNHEGEKDDTKVEPEEVKTECAVEERNKFVKEQPQTEDKQATKCSTSELDSKKEDDSAENANGTVSDDMSKMAASQAKQQHQQKKTKPLLKKFGSLLKRRNSK